MPLLENLVSKVVQITGLPPVQVTQGLILLAYVAVAYAMYTYPDRLPVFLKSLIKSQGSVEPKVEHEEPPPPAQPPRGYDVLANQIKQIKVQLGRLSLRATRMENLEKHFGVTSRLRLHGKGLWDPETGNLYDRDTFELLATGHTWSRPEVEEPLSEVHEEEVQPLEETPAEDLPDLLEGEVPIDVVPLEEPEQPPEQSEPTETPPNNPDHIENILTLLSDARTRSGRQKEATSIA